MVASENCTFAQQISSLVPWNGHSLQGSDPIPAAKSRTQRKNTVKPLRISEQNHPADLETVGDSVSNGFHCFFW